MEAGGAPSAFISFANVSDYIAPSQACVVPLAQQEKDEKPVQVTLNDCLACSGCITSAESVLISQQSRDEFLATLAENDPERKKFCAVSISPASAANIATRNGWTLEQAYRKLACFFRKTLGVDRVFSCDSAQEIALIECQNEAIARLQPRLNGTTDAADHLPLITGTCPGFVCYLEKVHPQLLPHLLTSPSLQATQGLLVKRVWAPRHSVRPASIYHVVLESCYDRKIEALRFPKSKSEDPNLTAAPVDCVLTTNEIQQLAESRGGWAEEADLDPISDQHPNSRPRGLPQHSGGYVQAVLRALGVSLGIPNAESQWTEGAAVQLARRENPDCREFTLTVPGKAPVTFASVFGFRNLQNLIRKIKTGKCPYLFIEAEACPGGCLGGGGQVPGSTPAAMLATLSSGTDLAWPADEELHRALLEALGPDYASARAGLHNSYQERGADNAPLATGVGINPSTLRW
ncbi:hydrogenase-like Nar1 protein [Paratrimastix pyriformis]|uniref:Hydrogenase-like Nar1 protein n=1 Tax=Paratrimastix pyriformis TaxID=342808 RepID=A0ABQ8UGR6_9EUKA|nr:hydrogenase-like Nar1 protein [Paratrimastix pyriformis]|eukprot:GAFH01001730.1.p1 GENE.GAFH01001730.1~~GAFH01001730.1.p1  ORF type:complete len:462 (+),score=47.43 GAFH01001730.1:1-1386(+)